VLGAEDRVFESLDPQLHRLVEGELFHRLVMALADAE
jgi:hypothetical protein